jgi:hypothetical protein
MTARTSWAPRRRAPCAEANQPAWRAAAPAEEAGPVLRAFVGARPAEPCLRLLKGRKGKIKIHRKMVETRVPSDIYPLRGKANRACGETSRTLVSSDAAEGWPAAGFDAASVSDARGAEGAVCPGDVTTAEGTTSRMAGTDTCSRGACGSAWPHGVTPIISAKGSSTPSARLRSSDQDPGVLAPNTGGVSPPGGWLDDPWPSLGSGLRPSRATMSSSSSSSSSSSGVSGDGFNGSPSLACLRRRFSKASRARILSRARAFSASFFCLSFSAASLRVVRPVASSGTGGREVLKFLNPWGRTKIPRVRAKDVRNTAQNRRGVRHLPGTHTRGRDASGAG